MLRAAPRRTTENLHRTTERPAVESCGLSLYNQMHRQLNYTLQRARARPRNQSTGTSLKALYRYRERESRGEMGEGKGGEKDKLSSGRRVAFFA